MSNFKKGGVMKKKILLMGFILLILTSCSSKDKNQVVVFNAGEYLDMDLIPEFEKETGIDVVLSLIHI